MFVLAMTVCLDVVAVGGWWIGVWLPGCENSV